MDHAVRQSTVLKLAAIYNLVWGASVVLFPNLFFDLTSLERPNWPEIWQCVGMIVGVYGVGYWIAARDPIRHWPVVLVGFLGKVFGPIGFVWAILNGRFNLAFGLLIVFNDFIWWIPFARILKRAVEFHCQVRPQDPVVPWTSLRLPNGISLESIIKPHLLLLVRHRGCTFCRSALDDLSKNEVRLVEAGVQPVVVHMGVDEVSEVIRNEFGLKQSIMVADPDLLYYRALGAKRGTWMQLFGPGIWWRGMVDAIVRGHGVGSLDGDGFMLGSLWLVHGGSVSKVHDPCDAADNPRWAQVLEDLAVKIDGRPDV